MQTRLDFKGEGSAFFGISIVNALLTIVTLGLYYPWAKAKSRRYIYSQTYLQGSPFSFTGTGREMFKGFIIAIGIYAGLIGLNKVLSNYGGTGGVILGAIVLLLGLGLLFPFAIHSSMRYRLSRTEWRGIRMGYRGTLGGLYDVMIKGFLLTIVTLGIYASWFVVSLNKYLYKNIHFGSSTFAFHGEGARYFGTRLVGNFLSVITLGIYVPWYIRSLIRFQVENTTFEHNGESYRLHTDIKVSQVFIGFILFPIFGAITFGIALPWAIMYMQRCLFNSIYTAEELNLETLLQTEAPYKSATGEDLADIIDIPMDFGL